MLLRCTTNSVYRARCCIQVLVILAAGPYWACNSTHDNCDGGLHGVFATDYMCW